MAITGYLKRMKNQLPLWGLVVVGGIGLGLSNPNTEPAAAGDAQYVGASKCKLCHKKSKSGDQYTSWNKGKHAKAFEVLASDAAKSAAKEKGIDDPQKSAECLQCHLTEHGKDAGMLAKKFKKELGVQCESCHGPGSVHVKARLAAGKSIPKAQKGKRQTVGEGEIVSKPAPETCMGCHNEKSPTFKGFCFKEKAAEIQHWDPRVERSAEHKAAWKCGGDGKCQKADCGGYPE